MNPTATKRPGILTQMKDGLKVRAEQLLKNLYRTQANILRPAYTEWADTVVKIGGASAALREQLSDPMNASVKQLYDMCQLDTLTGKDLKVGLQRFEQGLKSLENVDARSAGLGVSICFKELQDASDRAADLRGRMGKAQMAHGKLRQQTITAPMQQAEASARNAAHWTGQSIEQVETSLRKTTGELVQGLEKIGSMPHSKFLERMAPKTVVANVSEELPVLAQLSEPLASVEKVAAPKAKIAWPFQGTKTPKSGKAMRQLEEAALPHAGGAKNLIIGSVVAAAAVLGGWALLKNEEAQSKSPWERAR